MKRAKPHKYKSNFGLLCSNPQVGKGRAMRLATFERNRQLAPSRERNRQLRSQKGNTNVAKNISVFGIYPDRTTVSDAIDALHQARYRPADIAMLLSDSSGPKDFAHERRTKALEGAAAGAMVAVLVGAILAWLIASDRLTLPGWQPLVATTTAIAVLAGACA